MNNFMKNLSLAVLGSAIIALTSIDCASRPYKAPQTRPTYCSSHADHKILLPVAKNFNLKKDGENYFLEFFVSDAIYDVDVNYVYPVWAEGWGYDQLSLNEFVSETPARFRNTKIWVNPGYNKIFIKTDKDGKARILLKTPSRDVLLTKVFNEDNLTLFKTDDYNIMFNLGLQDMEQKIGSISIDPGLPESWGYLIGGHEITEGFSSDSMNYVGDAKELRQFLSNFGLRADFDLYGIDKKNIDQVIIQNNVSNVSNEYQRLKNLAQDILRKKLGQLELHIFEEDSRNYISDAEVYIFSSNAPTIKEVLLKNGFPKGKTEFIDFLNLPYYPNKSNYKDFIDDLPPDLTSVKGSVTATVYNSAKHKISIKHPSGAYYYTVYNINSADGLRYELELSRIPPKLETTINIGSIVKKGRIKKIK